MKPADFNDALKDFLEQWEEMVSYHFIKGAAYDLMVDGLQNAVHRYESKSVLAWDEYRETRQQESLREEEALEVNG